MVKFVSSACDYDFHDPFKQHMVLLLFVPQGLSVNTTEKKNLLHTFLGPSFTHYISENFICAVF